MTPDRELHLHTTLLSLTRLMSQWSSLALQQQVVASCGINLDLTGVRALYLLGLTAAPTPQSTLADELHLSRPSTSKLVTRLEHADLISRTPAPDDRRATLLSLTEAGRTTFGALFAVGITMLDQSTATWSDSETAALASLLERFVGTSALDVEPTH